MTSPFPPILLLDALLRGMLLALLALIAWVLGRDRRGLPAVRAGMALAAGLAVQIASTMPWFEQAAPRMLQAPAVAISVGNAVLFWIFVKALFDDGFGFRPMHALAWIVAAGLGGLNCIVFAHGGTAIAPYTMGLQRAIPLVFAVLTVQAAAAGWGGDLVEGRRRLRGFIVIGGIAYTLWQLAARLASRGGHLSDTGATLDAAMLLCVIAPVAFSMLRLARTELFAPARLQPSQPSRPQPPLPAGPASIPSSSETALADAVQAPAADDAELALVDALLKLMSDERAYRRENLSVASLASQLAVPEYRLRRVINQRLGHRNFNAFVNGFRVEEARAVLGDPASRTLPVLTIALETGFQSIGPFNRAFKAATGFTPTEYRRFKLADS
ncbi:AraC family transcriptional regulator [Cupriavidus sp. BIS7]|uniref:helix-turn-helix domain-containing protein n=1 Tax=Cupriavidus sp. BIS7 TaxID=1217718 RepID=UPI00037A25F3|nr:AraC family transcriptional regulator [Cupriavidus sp. BIS7]